MKQQLVVMLLAFILSVICFGRQIYDDETTCLDAYTECPDDGHIFKDDEIEKDEEPRQPLYPGYYAPEIEDGFEFS